MRRLSMKTKYGDDITLTENDAKRTQFPVVLQTGGHGHPLTRDECRMLSFFFERMSIADEQSS